MQSKFSLKSKGILLVAVPIVTQLIIIGVLITLLWSLQSDIAYEVRARNLAQGIGSMSISFLNDAISLLLDQDSSPPKTSHGPVQVGGAESEDPGKIEEYMQKVVGKFDQVLQLTETQPNEKPLVAKIRADTLQLSEVSNRLARQKSSREIWQQTHEQASHDACVAFQPLFDDVLKLMELDEHDRLLSPLHSEKTRQLVSYILMASVYVSIVIALISVRIFSIQIKRPLAQITKNGVLLAQQKELLPCLEVGDELSALDQTLHNAASAIKEVLARERATVEGAQSIICSVGDDLRFSQVSAYCSKLLALTTERLLGTAVAERIVPEQSLLAEEWLRKAQNSSEIQAFELMMLKADGTAVETRWSCLYSHHEKALFCVIYDVAEENRIARLKRDFLDMISHDLKGPLLSMLSSMNEIAHDADVKLEQDVRAEAKIVSSNISNLLSFVNELLDFQNLQSDRLQLTKQECFLTAILSEATRMVAGMAESNKVGIELPDGAWMLCCDRRRTIQVIVNLLSNAIKFSERETNIRVDVNETDQWLEILITDKGAGIPEQYQEKIFNAYVQMPEHKTQGTGLGLAICKLLMDAHGGSIGVRAAQDSVNTPFTSRSDLHQSGSTFWIRFPKILVPG